MASTAYGIDISGVDDVSPNLGHVTGRLALAQCCARRLLTRRGALWYDPNFGHDVRQYLSAPMFSPGQAAHACETELEKDERVDHATVVLQQQGAALSIRITLDDGAGPFSFTLSVSALRARLSP